MGDWHCNDLCKAVNDLEGSRWEVCVLDYQEFVKCNESRANLRNCGIKQEGLPDLLARRRNRQGQACLVVELKTCISGSSRQLEKMWKSIEGKISNARGLLSSLSCASLYGCIVVVPERVLRKVAGPNRVTKRDNVVVIVDILSNLRNQAERLIKARRG